MTARPDHRRADELAGVAEDAGALARKLGLDPTPVTYWLVDYDEMNELIAYDGFPTRYPHWRWGMQYERQRQRDRHGHGRAFEIVINDDPVHAFLQEANDDADQKAVITHVEAHADFFRHNRWYGLFGDDRDAVSMLEGHARRIERYMDDPEIGRETVERWIDTVLPLTDTIDQHRAFDRAPAVDGGDEAASPSPIAGLDLSDEVEDAVFDEAWLEAHGDGVTESDPARDVLAFIRANGRRYDEEEGRAVEMEDWRKDVIDVLRAEAYYFAPQRMTKICNEGWAAYWEAIMMGEEAFADDDEFVAYADHLSAVLGSPGLNPYRLGKELWESVENRANRREVAERLLRVEGITPSSFHDAVDFDEVQDRLRPEPPLDSITPETLPDLESLPDGKVDRGALDRARSGAIDVERHPWRVLTFEGLAERHFSLTKPRNRGFLARITRDELEEIARYLLDDDRFATVAAAIDAVSYTAGWDRLFEVREDHNDVTFLDEFLTPGFVREHQYFSYEYSVAADGFHVSSTDPSDVKKKLLLQYTNFGKPQIVAADGNYGNQGELLLVHEYNGIALDIVKARDTLKRAFELWGRPVNLKTIVKELDERDREVARRRGREPDPDETGKLLRYDGDAFELRDLDWEAVEDIAATDVDYGTKPEDWLA